MSDTIPNVPLPAGEWVDLYDATSITIGTQIAAQNLKHTYVRLGTQATEPVNTDGFNLLPPYKTALNDAGDSGAWAYSNEGGLLSVREISA